MKNTSPCGQHILKTEQHPNPPTPELGKVGAEHVLNLLARLKGDAPVMPAITLQSGLSLREEPQANVSRYEALRTVKGGHHVA